MKTQILKANLRKEGFVAKVTDDVEDVLENNKRLRSMPQRSDWGREVAEIPNAILIKWVNEENDRGNPIRLFTKEFMQLVKRKLKDPDWAHLRTDGYNFRTGYRGPNDH